MSEMNKCAECGMYVDVGTYHPYAACLMYQGCHDSQKVKANLDGVIAHGAQYESGFDDLADRYAALEARCRELEAENAALRHDLSKSMANHVADINGSQTETPAKRIWCMSTKAGHEGLHEEKADCIDVFGPQTETGEKS